MPPIHVRTAYALTAILYLINERKKQFIVAGPLDTVNAKTHRRRWPRRYRTGMKIDRSLNVSIHILDFVEFPVRAPQQSPPIEYLAANQVMRIDRQQIAGFFSLVIPAAAVTVCRF